MGTVRSGPFHSATTIRETRLCRGARGWELHPPQRPVACQLMRARTGSREQRTERLGSTFACPHQSPPGGGGLSPPMAAVCKGFSPILFPPQCWADPAPAHGPWGFHITCWCHSRAHCPVHGPVIRFPSTGRLRPIGAPLDTAGGLPFTHKPTPPSHAQDTARWPSLTKRLDRNPPASPGTESGS